MKYCLKLINTQFWPNNTQMSRDDILLYVLVGNTMIFTQHSVRRSKNEPTTTLPMKKFFFFEMSAAFEFCVSSSNFGFIG